MRVRRPDVHADRPRPLLLITIASGALIAGLGAARGLTLGERPRVQPSAISGTAPTLRGGASSASSAQSPAPMLQPPLLLAARTEVPPANQAEPKPDAEPEAKKDEPPRSAPLVAKTSETGRANAVRDSAADQDAVSGDAVAVQDPVRVRGDAVADSTAAPEQNTAKESAANSAQTSAPAATDEQQIAAPTHAVPNMHDGDAQPATPVHFERRFVAYVRCDGLPLGPGRFPCPRDPRLETAVWHALSALEACALAPAARGEGELRLEFKRFGVPALRFDAVGDGTLDREAVSKCADPSLTQLHTSLRPDHMVVAFRFELR